MEIKVTPAPHKHTRMTLNEQYIILAISLLLCLAMGMLYQGNKVLFLFMATTLTCYALDIACLSIKNKKLTFNEISSIITGLIITCLMPINAPWYFGIIAGFIAIASKYAFGGLGNNLFNPAALGRAVLSVLSADFIYGFYDGNTTLSLVLSGAKDEISLETLVIGKDVSGAIGTTCILAILVIAAVLMITKIIRWESVLSALIGFVLIIWVTMGFENVFLMLFSGSFLFVVVFMLSDPVTSSYNFSARCIYSLIFGVVAALMMKNNIMGETAAIFALLVANLTSSGLDRITSVFHRGVKND